MGEGSQSAANAHLLSTSCCQHNGAVTELSRALVRLPRCAGLDLDHALGQRLLQQVEDLALAGVTIDVEFLLQRRGRDRRRGPGFAIRCQMREPTAFSP